ncbi:MAG: undecaprenyl-diphosphate phosphatase [Prolixibacteraceae bacterium]
MEILQAIILGLIQGLTEFLPVSSSGHLEIGHVLFGIEGESSLLFDVILHGATVLSTLVVFRKDIIELFKGLFEFKWNEPTKYVSKLLLSALPVGIAGVLFKDQIESLFLGNLLWVGSALLLTAALLAFANFARAGERKIGYIDAIMIGVAQMLAVVPGISRSGSTIATGMILGNSKTDLAKFSFLMVILPILGANFLTLASGDLSAKTDVSVVPMVAGFIAAFVSGLLACKWMVNIVRKGKLIYFAIYCAIVGSIAIFAA